MDLTPRLGLQKPDPDPVTGDFLDIAILNANMDKVDAVISALVCTSGTRPASPFDGQIIRETNTRRMYIWNATQSSWDQIATAGGTFLGTTLALESAASGDNAFTSRVTGEPNTRFLLEADGMHWWGPGSVSQDTNLYRRAANLLGTDDSFQASGYCSGLSTESVRTTSTGNISTTETVIQSVSFSAISGAQYMVFATQHFQGATTNDTGWLRLRYAAGGSVTAAGTQLTSISCNVDQVSRAQPYSFHGRFVAPSTGQFTVGVTLVRGGGTNNVSSPGTVNAENVITVTGA